MGASDGGRYCSRDLTVPVAPGDQFQHVLLAGRERSDGLRSRLLSVLTTSGFTGIVGFTFVLTVGVTALSGRAMMRGSRSPGATP